MKRVLFLLSVLILQAMLTISCITVKETSSKKRVPQKNEKSDNRNDNRNDRNNRR